MTHPIPPWSYSALNAFETCPRRYFITKVSKQVVEPETEATRWGTHVHEKLEHRVRDNTPLPETLQSYEPYAARFAGAAGSLLVEYEVALTSAFQPTTWRAPDAWVRGIIDVGVVKPPIAVLADWKTGKRKADSDQLKLFAGFAFAALPEVETVRTSFIWLKTNQTDDAQFTRADVPSIWQTFLPRVERLHNAYKQDAWPPKPSGLCRAWCPVGKSLCSFCGT